MSLLAAFLAIVEGWRNVFPQQRTFQRGVRQAFGSLVCLGRCCLTRIIWTNGGQDRSWGAEYFLHSRCQWEPQELFRPILKQSLEYCPQRLVGVAIDDTRLRKTGRSIPQAFYQRDPLPPFHVNLVLGLRFLQASLLVPLHRNAPVGTRALPIRFQEVSRVKRPGKRATEQMHQQYREAAKQKNLSRSFVEMGQQLRRELDDAGGRNKVLVLAGDGSFCNRTCFAEIPERSVLLVRARFFAWRPAPLLRNREVYAATGAPGPKSPMENHQDLLWRQAPQDPLQRSGAGVLAARRQTASPSSYRHRADSLSQEPKQEAVLPRSGVLVDYGSAQLDQAVTTNLLRPVADRGQPQGREGYLGRWASPVMECDFGAQTAGAGGGGLQRFVARFAQGLWGGARCRLCPTPQVAPKRSTAILFGSDHSTPQGDRTTTYIP
jgi:DDE superfamily endonuclease